MFMSKQYIIWLTIIYYSVYIYMIVLGNYIKAKYNECFRYTCFWKDYLHHWIIGKWKEIVNHLKNHIMICEII